MLADWGPQPSQNPVSLQPAYLSTNRDTQLSQLVRCTFECTMNSLM